MFVSPQFVEIVRLLHEPSLKLLQLRIINAFRFCLRSQRSPLPLTPTSIFQPLITTSRGPLLEVDFVNYHKHNSTYFSDVDVARTHLFCTLFSLGIEKFRGGTSALSALRNPNPIFGIALGGLAASFKREIMPYEGYEMWTRVLAWDGKWIYVVTHFVEKNASRPRSYSLYPSQEAKRQRQSSRDSEAESRRSSTTNSDSENERPEEKQREPKIFATILSKCVCKLGRKSVAPEVMLKMSKLIPLSEPNEESGIPFCPYPSQRSILDLGTDAESSTDTKDFTLDPWSLEKVEEERKRGLEIAQKMLSGTSQTEIEAEFDGSSQVLGKHTDGNGIVGVVTTLASLGGLWNGQIL
jgi:hypothetical protein